MSLTPKERQQKIEERELIVTSLNYHNKATETHRKLFEKRTAELAQLDRELAEPEDWVPNVGEGRYDCICIDGRVGHLICSGSPSDRAIIAFNNFFQPDTGQAEAVAPYIQAQLKIAKVALSLGINGADIGYCIERYETGYSFDTRGCNELARLCPSEIETVRKWNTK